MLADGPGLDPEPGWGVRVRIQVAFYTYLHTEQGKGLVPQRKAFGLWQKGW